MANRFLRWYSENYPSTFHEVAMAFGLTPEVMGELLYQGLNAKVWRWDPVKERHVQTGEPNWSARYKAWDRLLKLMEKDDKWKRKFVEQDQNRPPDLTTTPEFDTVEEFEAWAKKRNVLKEIEGKRKAATEARDRRLAEEGRMPMPKAPTGTTE